MRVLDAGCGRAKVAGAIGIDIHPESAADIRADLDRTPWPLADSTFDRVRLEHCLEHLRDPIRVLEECHRVARPGGEILIEIPYVSHFQSWRDPTHRFHPTWETFDYFDAGSPFCQLGGYTTRRFRLREKRLVFGKSVYDLLGRCIFALSPRWYEKYFMWRYPARELVVRLEVLKPE